VIRTFLEAAQLALREAGVPGVKAPAMIAKALAGGSVPKPGPRPSERGVVELEWCALSLAHHALAGDTYETFNGFHGVVYTLFSHIGPFRSSPAFEDLPDDPTALLDAVVPPPRVISRELAQVVRSVPTLREWLWSPARETRTLALRSLPDEAIAPLADLLADILLCDVDPGVRDEAWTALLNRSDTRTRELVEQLRLRMTTPIVSERAAAIRMYGGMGGRLPVEDVLALLNDPEIEIARAALDAHVFSALRDARCIEPLRRLLADTVARPQAVRCCTRVDDASPLALELVRALEYPECAARARQALGRIGKLPVDAVALLQQQVLGPRSDVARHARAVLEKAAPDQLVDVPLAERIARITRELASEDVDTQLVGVSGARELSPADAAPLLAPLRALGERSADDHVFHSVRHALAAIGVAHERLPRAPCRLESHRGFNPIEWPCRGPWVIGTIREALPTPTGEVRLWTVGLWDNVTGKLLFIIDDGYSLAFVPKRPEALILRVTDGVWYLERYAIPSGQRMTSLAIPEELTKYKSTPGVVQLTIGGDLATIACKEWKPGTQQVDSEIVLKVP
jgi:hypothetical protein